MSDFIEAELRDRLKGKCELETLRNPERGLRSDLVLATGAAGRGAVIRFFKDRAEGIQVEEAGTFAAEAGVRVPELILADNSRAHFKRHGFGVIVERLIEGEHPEAGALGPEQLGELGKALGQLHSTQRKHWGPLGRNRRSSYFKNVIVKRISNRLDSLERFHADYDPEWRSRMMGVVQSAAKSWDGGPPFALTHDKINSGNLIVGEGGAVTFLDVETLQFGAPGKDLAAALYYFCESEADEAHLRTEYFAAAGEAQREHFARFEALYRAWHHLGRWTSKTRAYHKKRKRYGVEADEELVGYSTRIDEQDATWRWVNRLEESLGELEKNRGR